MMFVTIAMSYGYSEVFRTDRQCLYDNAITGGSTLQWGKGRGLMWLAARVDCRAVYLSVNSISDKVGSLVMAQRYIISVIQ